MLRREFGAQCVAYGHDAKAVKLAVAKRPLSGQAKEGEREGTLISVQSSPLFQHQTASGWTSSTSYGAP